MKLKNGQDGDTPSKSCSCSSCFYRSDAERPSIRRIIEHGSRLDKLYLGKFIPLREKKLLHRLVKTRAAYDDIRNQILTESIVNIKQKNIKKPSDSDELQSSILSLVNLVDKDANLRSNQTIDCCSCCSCSSKLNLQEETLKQKKYEHVRPAKLVSKSGINSKNEATRSVTFGTKHIQSDPCTCTLKFSKLRRYKSKHKRIQFGQPSPVIEPMNTLNEDSHLRSRKTQKETKVTKRKKQSKTSLMESNATRSRDRAGLLKRTRSKERGMQSKQKISHGKTNNFNQYFTDYDPDASSFRIRKNSVTKFRESFLKRRRRKLKPCDSKICVNEDCNPEGCYRRQQKADLHERRRTIGSSSINVNTELRKTNIKVGINERDKLQNKTTKISALHVELENEKINKNKLSQIDIPIDKTKDTSADQILHNCLCSLKLGKPGDHKVKKYTTSKSFITPPFSIAIPPKHKLRSKYGIVKNSRSRALLQEYEPEMYIPDQCDPEDCKKEINMIKDAKNYLDRRELKSTKSMKNKNKHKSHSSQANSEFFKKGSKYIKAFLPEKSTQNVVKIGSSLSFSVEVFKENSDIHSLAVNRYKENNVKTQRKRLDANKYSVMNKKNLSKSSSTQVKRKEEGISFDRHTNRCICTLKLHKLGKITKDRIEKNMKSTSTETSKKYKLPVKTATKSTKTKNKIKEINKKTPKEIVRPSKIVVTDTTKLKSVSNDPLISEEKRIRSANLQTNLEEGRFLTEKNYPLINNKNNLSLSRQIVKLGSSFSFSIEFSKNSSLSEKRITKKSDGRIKPLKISRANPKTVSYRESRELQSNLGKRYNKKTVVHPMLKRCFCTLKLQSKDNSNENMQYRNVYTVSRMLEERHKYKQYEKCITNRETQGTTNIERNWSKNEILSNFSATIVTKSCPFKYKEMQSYFREKKTFSGNIRIPKTNQNEMADSETYIVKDQILKNISKLDELRQIMSRNIGATELIQNRLGRDMCIKTGVNPFLKRCFCTMNIQLPNKENKRTSNPRGIRKLKPYECEPHVCTPGECDPIECQKLINKRLMRSDSKIIGNNHVKTKSTTSLISQTKPRSKDRKMNHNIKPNRKEAAKSSITLPNTSNRQVTHIGSTLSFDIEFFKNRKGDLPEKSKPKGITSIQRRTDLKTKSTFDQRYRPHDRETQYFKAKAVDESSLVRTKKDKCFCTLKLQKIGKLNQEEINKTNQSSMTPPNAPSEIVAIATESAAVNTKNPEFRKILLKPYECEPNVCSPGECDPFACLELIKSRNKKYHSKHLGTYSLPVKTTSSSTSKQGLQGTKKIQSDLKNSPKKDKQRMHYSQSIIDYARNQQAVRIGSNISFEMSFFKEKPSLASSHKKIKNVTTPDKHEYAKITELHNNKKNTNNDVIIQDHINKRNRYSQIQKLVQQVTTKIDSNIMKRCFCTAKLYQTKIKNIKKQNVQNKTSNAKITDNSDKIQWNPTSNVRTATNLKIITAEKIDSSIKPRSKLKPYECEPGVCIPDECNPNICQKMIIRREEKRTNKLKMTDTGRANVKSISSSYKSSRTSKARKTQSSGSRHNIMVKNRNYDTVRQQGLSKSQSPDRQAVRVGSTFSFNIDFYKEKPAYLTYLSSNSKNPVIAQSNNKTRVIKLKNSESRNKGSNKKQINVAYSSAQTEKNNRGNHSSGVNSIIKRCFCTLNLHHKEKTMTNKNKGVALVSHGTKPYAITPQAYVRSKTITTQSENKSFLLNLEPFECEPGVCIPGKCNPHECIKLINKRRMKHKGSNAYVHGSNLISNYSMTDYPQHKDKKLQNAMRRKFTKVSSATTKVKNRKPKMDMNRTSLSGVPRQAVRIGSTFSFDIEFFKEKSPEEKLKNLKIPKPLSNNNTSSEINKKKKIVQNEMTPHRKKSHTQTAMPNSVIATTTDKNSLLNRCFCTLSLKRAKTVKGKTTTTKNSNMGTITSDYFLKREDPLSHSTQTKYDSKGQYDHFQEKRQILDQYECEPGTCIPGACNPYDCEKLIRMRNTQYRQSRTNTRERKAKSVYSMTDSVLTKQRKLQHNFNRQKAYIKHHKKQLPSLRKFKQSKNYINEAMVRPSRQAVRIGSSFNFDIEFFKDRSPGGDTVGIRNTSKETEVNAYRNINHSIVSSSPVIKKRNEVKNQSRVTLKSLKMQASNKAKNAKSGMSPFLERCFCTLSLTRSNENKMAMKRMSNTGVDTCDDNVKVKNPLTISTQTIGANMKHPLDPHECEPGACIPGECNPFECKKLIKKRYTQHRESGTYTKQHKSKSVYSLTDSVFNKNKKLQHNLNRPKTYNKQQTLQPRSHRRSKHPEIFRNEAFVRPSRQAVRIGSSFNFDIEFFKDRSPGGDTVGIRNTPKETDVDAYRNINNSIVSSSPVIKKKRNEFKNQSRVKLKSSKIQSSSIAKNATTGMSPFLKRCFCTLSLRQSDKNKMAVKKISNVGVDTSDDNVKVRNPLTINTQTVGANMKYSLDPHECEPGVCIPGECNPYECEKLIKKRCTQHRESGTYTKQHKSKSVYSLTDSVLNKNKKLQHNLNRSKAYNKLQTQQIRSHRRSKQPENFVNEALIRPSRQAVRIGSSFNFDIEFFKDRSPGGDTVNNRNTPKETDVNAYRNINHSIVSSSPVIKKKQNEVKNQSRVTLKSSKIQASSIAKNATTGMSPYLKRCFCTLSLRQSDKNKMAVKKISNVGVDTSDDNVKVRNPLTINTQTVGANMKYSLDPHECEPGVCIPGECNPYECEKLIRKRQSKYLDSGTSTKRNKSRSVYSMRTVTPYKKNRKLQINTSAVRSKPSSFFKTKHKRPQKNIDMISSDKSSRHAVRIGSSFNFDIEFYKDRSPAGDTVTSTRPLERYNQHKLTNARENNMKVEKTTEKAVQNQYHQKALNTQTVNKSKNEITSVSPFLKRCFCTLSLKNKNAKKKSRIGQSTMSTKTNDVIVPVHKNTQSTNTTHARPDLKTYKLDPYECEPGICIPGECNPYNCKKLIRKRPIKYQDLSTTTNKHKAKSVYSMINSPYYKTQKMQFDTVQPKLYSKPVNNVRNKYKDIKKNKKHKVNRNPIINTSSKQAVKVGSSFNFDIEFYKDRSPCGDSPNINKNSYFYDDFKTVSKSSKITGPKAFNQIQKDYINKHQEPRKRNFQIQTLSKKVASTITGVSPLFKRCFCTLTLTKPKKSNLSTTLKKNNLKYNNSRTLLKEKLNPRINKGTATTKFGKLKSEKINRKSKFNKQINLKRKSRSKKIGTKNHFNESLSNFAFKNKITPYHQHINEDYNFPRVNERSYLPNVDPDRQAVRIGSSFNFNVEFYKSKNKWPFIGVTGMPKHEFSHDARNGNNKYNMQKGSAGKGTTRHRASHLSRNKKDRGASSSINYRHRKSQIKSYRKDKDAEIQNVTNQNRQSQIAPDNRNNKNARTDQMIDYSHRKSQIDPITRRDIGADNQDIDYNHRWSQAEPRIYSKGAGTAGDKCVCTVKLQTSGDYTRSSAVGTHSPTYLPKQHRNTLTKLKHVTDILGPYECEVGTCVPGECDPYECEKRIKQRFKTKGLGTTPKQFSQASVCTKDWAFNNKAKRTQSIVEPKRKLKIPKDIPPLTYNRPYKHNNNSRNKQAVKIGSAFSFDIEFFKEKSPNIDHYNSPLNYPTKLIKTSPGYHSGSFKSTGFSNKLKSHNRDSQAKMYETANKGTGVRKLIKRCFCTAKLHQKEIAKQNVVTVNRVEIEKSMFQNMYYPNKFHEFCVQYHTLKTPFNKAAGDQAKRKNPNQNIKTVGTKMGKKRVAFNSNVCEISGCSPESCDPVSCKSKFEKYRHSINSQHRNDINEVETILPYTPNKFKKHASKTVFKKTKKIFKNQCRCCADCRECNQYECKQDNGDNNDIVSKKTFKFPVKNAKPNINSDQTNIKEPKVTFDKRKTHEMFNIKSLYLRIKELIYCKAIGRGNKVDNFKETKSEHKPLNKTDKDMMRKTKSVKDGKDKPHRKRRFSSSPGATTPKENLTKKITTKTKSTNLINKSITKEQPTSEDNKKQQKVANIQKSLEKEKHNTNLKSKLVGDSKKLMIKNNSNDKKGTTKIDIPKNKSDIKMKLFQFTLPKVDARKDLRNKSLKNQRKAAIKSKNNSKALKKKANDRNTCLCRHSCECRFKPIVKSKSSKLSKRNKNAHAAPSPRIISFMNVSNIKNLATNVSGMYFGRNQTPKVLTKKEKIILKKKMKVVKKKKKVRNKKRALRYKNYKKEDDKIRLERSKIDRKKNQQMNEYKYHSNWKLIFDSLLEVGTLGSRVFCDAMRNLFRKLRHPTDLIAKDSKSEGLFGEMIDDMIHEEYDDIGGPGAMKRIRRRIVALSIIKTAWHAVRKFQNRRYRHTQPGCHMFLASLRKRPFLWVYDLCPWFYPHCISLLSVWRQFADIMLFLLAVVVWCPCILCIEFSRAMMCCL